MILIWSFEMSSKASSCSKLLLLKNNKPLHYCRHRAHCHLHQFVLVPTLLRLVAANLYVLSVTYENSVIQL
jgi:hypothetical protein